MFETDSHAFFRLLDDVAALLQRPGQAPLSPQAKAMYFRALGAYSLSQVQEALDAHVKDPQRGRFMPLPADVIAQIDGNAEADGRPGAEEAWAIALRASDEAETVVWTNEIAEALGIARPILATGDDVGARMAFKEAYTRLIDGARHARMPVQWSASLGFDKSRRDEAVRAAVEAGKLPMAMLPAPQVEGVPLLELSQVGAMPEHVRLRLRELAESIRAKSDEPSRDAIARAETQAKRAATQEQVEAYAQEKGIDLANTPVESMGPTQ